MKPPAIHVFDRALADPRSKARVERMLAALGMTLEAVPCVSDSDIPELVKNPAWAGARVRQGKLDEHRDPALVFTTMRFENRPPAKPVLDACPAGTSASLVNHLLGYGGHVVAREDFRSQRGVCRPRVQFETIYGCPHGCIYCPGGRVAVIFTNVEEFVEKQVIPASRQEPWQKVFMFNSSLTDTPCFEPEYGLSKLLVEYFATTPDQHYLIHTKSNNTDFLCDLDHRGHTIVLWSLTGETGERLVEPGTPSGIERIEAARRCQQAGYPIRFKLKPIVPVRGWRDEYSRLVERIFARTRPDNIGLFMLAWMDYQELAASLDLEVLDPAFRTAVRDHADEMKGVPAGPFPHEVRAEVYSFIIEQIRKHDADVPLFLCTETPAMWADFSERLGVDPTNYVCGCGPQSMPKLTRLASLNVPTALRQSGAAAS